MSVVLQVRDLAVSFDTDEGRVRAVDGVSFDLSAGDVVGLVGESGCGKTVTALSILRLVPSPPGIIERGEIWFEGRDLLKISWDEMRDIRGASISMVFQDPMTALSPLHRVGAQMVETLRLHRRISKREAWELSASWLTRVGIPSAEEQMHAYPHQLSGGMRQRVLIAMALMLEPRLILADEPTTALDVTLQAQIFNLLLERRARDSTVLLITHDLGVVWEWCQKVLVMYAGRLVETGPVSEVLERPRHPYTEALLRSLPARQAPGAKLEAIRGQVPAPGQWPPGCRFSDRCPKVFAKCREVEPLLQAAGPGRAAACHWVGT